MIVAQARALIGTRFRFHGRDPATGLDCVGLVGAAYGVVELLPTGYPLRGGRAGDYVALIDRFAARRGTGAPSPADIMLIAISPAQFHLGVWTGTGLIHAHAGLRRVVETPGLVRENIIALWSADRELD